MKRLIVHADMDAFYASVEELDHPEYIGKPLIVGSDPEGGKGRGVVSTCNYAARKFGIHSAMPISHAYRACPQGIFVFPRMERYAEISRMIMEVFASFSPLVEPLSLDEAFIDCTGTERLFGDPLSLGRLIKSKVFETTGLRVSVGIAANKFVAKVASDLQKPDGLTICPEGGEAEFLRNLPIRKLWGVGPKTAEVLARKKINTIGDLSDFGEEASIRLMGDHGRTLYQLSLGKDSRPVLPSSGRKSISEERTFRTDKTDREELTAVLFRLADEVSHKMRFEKIKGKTIQIKIRQSNFHTITRSLTLPKATSESEVISNETISLFKKNDPGGAIRLVGVGMTNFSDESDELDLFSFSETTKSQKVDRLLDTLRDRFDDKISRAVFIKKE